METRNLHFSVDGDFITNLAREQCHYNGRLKYAVNLLTSAMQTDEMTPQEIEHTAYDILNGRARIAGVYPGPDYHVEYIPGNEHKCDLNDTFERMKKQIEECESELEDLQERYLYLCDQIPEYQSNRILSAHKNEKFADECNTYFNNHADDKDENSAFSEQSSAISRIADVISNPYQALDEFMNRMHSDDSDNDYGWLEPDGTYHPVEWGKHTEWASEYLEKHFPYTTKPNDSNAKLYWRTKPDGTQEYINGGDVLVYSLGWILIDNPAQGMGRHTCRPDRPMTKAQREFLFDYYTKRGATHEANALYADDND